MHLPVSHTLGHTNSVSQDRSEVIIPTPVARDRIPRPKPTQPRTAALTPGKQTRMARARISARGSPSSTATPRRSRAAVLPQQLAHLLDTRPGPLPDVQIRILRQASHSFFESQRTQLLRALARCKRIVLVFNPGEIVYYPGAGEADGARWVGEEGEQVRH
jgi:hypothetical protein